MTLREFAQGKTQPQLAEMLGVSQGAVSQMLNSTRDIRVKSDGQGGYEFIEIRQIGGKHKERKSKDH
ncbi:helix-turn-helix transcriptional regulator [Pseudomonas sp. zfem002]|uniref:helix-turn-helix transcriptional regulator n=1 Tax=Pseudomonas sp. zfem002 TaxID=3078197 RepID=UPI0029292250|nr:helix-turn-helix transcriptional regulator [Pseudomonas sp. zfem002]MDU9391559.1 helix-turn-helix transcriptional regulator [Pseudomonas sp. zfem002]